MITGVELDTLLKGQKQLLKELLDLLDLDKELSVTVIDSLDQTMADFSFEDIARFSDALNLFQAEERIAYNPFYDYSRKVEQIKQTRKI